MPTREEDKKRGKTKQSRGQHDQQEYKTKTKEMMKKGQNKQQNNNHTEIENFPDWYCNIPEEDKEGEDKEEAENQSQEGKNHGQNNNQPKGEEEEEMEQDQTPTQHIKDEEARKDQETEHRRPAQGPEQETAGKTSLIGRTSSNTGDRKSQERRPNSRKRKCPTQLQPRQKSHCGRNKKNTARK